ncbi:DUF1348 family protein [Rhodopila sp.]|uniref:DUF1348 family protein n=1 Tax=Rhodopila sp. TaxID=2480087 RepID=UPI003D0B0700
MRERQWFRAYGKEDRQFNAEGLMSLRLACCFRANIYFDGEAPWSELNWVSKVFLSSNVLLGIVRHIRRCPATSVDLERGVRDLNVPRSILDFRGHGDCGIYAEILSSGRLRPSAKLSLLDDRQEMPDVFVSSEAGYDLLNSKGTSQ